MSETFILSAGNCSRGGKSITSIKIHPLDTFFQTWKSRGWGAPLVYTLKADGKSTPERITQKRLKAEFSQYTDTEFYKSVMGAA